MSSLGFIDWLLTVLGLRGGVESQSFDPDNRVVEFDPDRGTIEEFVVTPCGYRIRVPSTDEVGHSVGEMLPEVRDSLAQVPPLPQVVIELLREVQDAHSTAASVASVASTDPVLAAALLRTVNSAAMGLSRKIASVTEAVSYLGFGLVKSVLIRLRLDETLPTTGKMGADAEDLWVHSLATSYVAEVLADRVRGVDRGFVSTLGLLHDIGKLAMMSKLKILGQMALAPSASDEAGRCREARVLGVDHAGLGAALAHAWGLPADLVRAIRFHHHPEQAYEATDPVPLRQAAMIVYVANQLAKYGYGHADDIEVAAIPPGAGELLGIDVSLSALMDQKVTGAISKAILFVAENTKQPKTIPKRLIRLRRGPEVVQFAKAAAVISPRVSVDEQLTPLFSRESDAAAILRASGTTRESDVAKLIDAGLFHQSKMSLPPSLAAPAAELLRCLLPNVVEAKGEHPVNLVQQLTGPTFLIALHCEALGFAQRVGTPTTTEQGLTLLQAEFGGLMNLGWVDSIRCSPDGTMLAIEMKQH
jgi:putative nucleotidyltransferase with HDIG domain